MFTVSVKGRIVVVVEIPLRRHTSQCIITHPNNCIPPLRIGRLSIDTDIPLERPIPLGIVLGVPTVFTVSVKGRIVVVVEIALRRHTPQGVITHQNNCVPLLGILRLSLDPHVPFECPIPPGIVLGIPTVIVVGVCVRIVQIVEITLRRRTSECIMLHPNNCIPPLDIRRLSVDTDIPF